MLWRGALGAVLLLLTGATVEAQTQAERLSDRSFDCLMEAHVIVKLGTAVTGLISKVTVDRGDIVKEGQVIAELDSDVQKVVVALAEMKATNEYQIFFHRSRKEFLKKKLERIATLEKQDIASTAALDEVVADLKASENSEQEAELGLSLAKLELQREREILKQRQIRSPINGVVIERVLFTGEYQSETNHLLTIAETDPLNVEVILPIAYYGQLRIGSMAEIRPEDPIGGVYTAKVVVIDRVFDARSGTFGVRLNLPNTNHALPAGIRCTARFQ